MRRRNYGNLRNFILSLVTTHLLLMQYKIHLFLARLKIRNVEKNLDTSEKLDFIKILTNLKRMFSIE